jgi:hypothetical protein
VRTASSRWGCSKYRPRAGISQSGTIFAGMMPASTSGARRSGITLESANWPQTMLCSLMALSNRPAVRKPDHDW